MKLQEIEQAIDQLSQSEIDELHSWLDQHHPHSIDIRIQRDADSGRLHDTMDRAVKDEAQGRTTPL
ncbi:MAG TPA: hypothetical protein VFB14_18395 [Bryobacteraceae bacterium]|nr:hypothetical protein [Bryobacteraceae bacterium]